MTLGDLELLWVRIFAGIPRWGNNSETNEDRPVLSEATHWMFFSRLYSLRWFAVDFFARGLHTRIALTLALARLSCYLLHTIASPLNDPATRPLDHAIFTSVHNVTLYNMHDTVHCCILSCFRRKHNCCCCCCWLRWWWWCESVWRHCYSSWASTTQQHGLMSSDKVCTLFYHYCHHSHQHGNGFCCWSVI